MALSEEDLEQVKGLVNSTINGVVTSLKKNSELQQTKAAEAFSKMLDDKLAALKPPEPKPEEGKTDKDGKPSKGETLAIATLNSQMAEMRKRMEDSDKRAAAAVAANRAATKERNVSVALSKHGIDGMRFQGAYAMLERAGKIKHASEEGDDLVFVDDTGAEVDLAVGLEQWAKSEPAKMFMPPTGAAGSGQRRPPPGGKPPEKREVTYEDVGNAFLGLVNGNTPENPKLGG